MSASASPLVPSVSLAKRPHDPAAGGDSDAFSALPVPVRISGRRQPPDALCDLRELTYRYRTRLDSNGEAVRVARSLDNWDATAAVLGQLLEDEAVEVLGVLCLTTRRQIICWHEVSRGGLAGTSCQVADVLRPAIIANAAAVVVAHNHPSGDPEPSEDDLRATRMICEAGALMGVRVVDHLVVGYRGFVSLRRVYPVLFQSSERQVGRE